MSQELQEQQQLKAGLAQMLKGGVIMEYVLVWWVCQN